ncbi:MAG TPA: hypothetical protein VET86_12595 [Casimicrobiaceae bacterium]|nr:hypothetical protein [Casimicrobiaceae bacterium]
MCALGAAALVADAAAAPRTVCTITVNSANEKETLKRRLPEGDYRFVELVERGRPDWLAAACRSGVRCDALVISGHFDGGTEFYTDRLEQRESLPVDEMRRAACSEACPGVFAQVREVYLFGCNTLNADGLTGAAGEVARRLVRAGASPADAERVAHALNDRHRESNRDRMRQIFKDVPVIYGFSSKAPLGPSAAATLDRWLQASPPREIGSGQANAKLVSLFAPASMTVVTGLSDGDPDAAFRRDVCRLADDRLSAAEKLGFVHEVLQRDPAEVRMLFDHVEHYAASLTAVERQTPAAARALEAIEADREARERYLAFVRDDDEPAVRVRMLAFAREIGWLTPAGLAAEYRRMLADRLRNGATGATDVELACSLNRDHELGSDPLASREATARVDPVARAAVLACLDSAEAQRDVLRALTSARESDVELARVYLRHRPIVAADELRAVTAGIARMQSEDAQARALEQLAAWRLSDPASLEELARLFPRARSLDVQRAIAAVLIRGDYRAIAKPELVRALRTQRLRSPDGEDVIDALIRRLQLSL